MTELLSYLILAILMLVCLAMGLAERNEDDS